MNKEAEHIQEIMDEAHKHVTNNKNNIETFDSFYLQYDSWDTGMIFICVVYGLLIVELLLNRTVKIFRKKK